jgi:hypothetical protein
LDSIFSATAFATLSTRGADTPLQLLERAVVWFGRQALVNHLIRARDVAGAPGGFGELQLQRAARPSFIDRAIEPANGQLRFPELA